MTPSLVEIDMAKYLHSSLSSAFFTTKSYSVTTLPTHISVSRRKSGEIISFPKEKIPLNVKRNPGFERTKPIIHVNSGIMHIDKVQKNRRNDRKMQANFGTTLHFAYGSQYPEAHTVELKRSQELGQNLEISQKKVLLRQRDRPKIRLKPRYRSNPPMRHNDSKESFEDDSPSKSQITQNIERLVREQVSKRLPIHHQPRQKPVNIHYLLRQSEARKVTVKAKDGGGRLELKIPME